MKIYILIFAASVLLSGCNPALMQPTSPFARASKVVCHEVVPVGSHLKQRVCTTTAALEEDSQGAKQVLAEAQQRLRDDLAMERAMRSRAPRGP